MTMILVGEVQMYGQAPQFKSRSVLQAGISQTNPITSQQVSNITFILNGWGLAIRDINLDGWPDLVLGGKPGWGGVYYSDRGPWKFTNANARLSETTQKSTIAGIVITDLDRDGQLDLITSTYDAGIRVSHGNGQAGLSTQDLGYNAPKGAYWGGMAVSDIDQDGNVDIVALGYRQNRSRNSHSMRTSGGADRRFINTSSMGSGEFDSDRFRVSSTGLVAEMGAASAVLSNRGGTNLIFRPFSTIADYGNSVDKALELDWSLSCAFQDINGDGLPDLYVCNDYHSPDRLWINAGGGRFVDKIEDHVPYTSLFSMGVAFTDINKDGVPDWIVTDMLPRNPTQRILEYDDTYLNEKPSELFGSLRQISRNTVFVSNRPHRTWNEVGTLNGLAASGWSWGPVWLDINGDGRTDLLVPSGYAQNLQDQGKPRDLGVADFYSTKENGLFVFVQTPDGRFQEQSEVLGLAQARSITMAVVPCDMDHDGDPDLVVHNFAEPLQMFENRTDGRFVCLSLEATPGGLPLEGTRVRWKSGTRAGPSTWFGGGTYLSSPPPEFYAPLDSGVSKVSVEVTWVDERVDEYSLPPGWHGIRAPKSKPPGPTRPPVTAELPVRSTPYNKRGEFRLPGTSGDHHDDLFLQVHLPVSLDGNRFLHKTLGNQVWVADSGGGSLVKLTQSGGGITNWSAELILKRVSPAPAAFLPGPNLGWIENTYRHGARYKAGVSRLESGSSIQAIGTVPDHGLTRVVGPDSGPWLLGGAGHFGRFPEYPNAVLWDVAAGTGAAVTNLPFESRISDAVWMDSGGGGTWVVSEWFGRIWETSEFVGSGRWKPIVGPVDPAAVTHVQTALFKGPGSRVRGREEVLVAGYGLNNEWVFRADGHLGWLLVRSTNETEFSGLIESMWDAEGVARPLIPFKHFKGDPDEAPFSNVVEYSKARGKRIHRGMGAAKRVDVANSMLSKGDSGRWERRPLPLELQVAPIRDAVVIPTPEGPAWLITFKETDGHRTFGSPPQSWPALVFWPGSTGGTGKVSSAEGLGFSGLIGDAQLIVAGETVQPFQVLAVWTDGRRCSVYRRSDQTP
ncbi:MAG: VCBS repeat-containing protein [Verrucomicrobia bacterium]|nr:VCBS repeat-containing protein [Verrucomicrobiota bacterium]